ncbi:MAG TPA: phosphate ABC transporter substrate-binding protein [Solirubrobacterales bacterium]
MRNRLRWVGLFAALAIVAAVPAAAPAVASAKTTITMSGSTTVAPLAALLARKYLQVCDRCISFKLLQGGSDIGVADVAAGRVTIGNSSRDPKPSDPGGLVFNTIAHDALCLVSNKANPVPGLDQAGIQAVFGGSVRSWSQVPGSTQTGTIDLFTRTAASGTQDAFLKIFMGSTKVFSGASQKGSNGLVEQSVAADPGGIGYVSLAFTKNVHTIPYKGVECNLRNAKSGQYGGVRNLYMVTRGAPTGATAKWINWITHSKDASKIIATQWVPLT